MTRADISYSMTVRLDGVAYVFEPDESGRGWRHPELGHVTDAVEMYETCLAHVEEQRP